MATPGLDRNLFLGNVEFTPDRTPQYGQCVISNTGVTVFLEYQGDPHVCISSWLTFWDGRKIPGMFYYIDGKLEFQHSVVDKEFTHELNGELINEAQAVSAIETVLREKLRDRLGL